MLFNNFSMDNATPVFATSTAAEPIVNAASTSNAASTNNAAPTSNTAPIIDEHQPNDDNNSASASMPSSSNSPPPLDEIRQRRLQKFENTTA